jgi:hypothetical protein
MLSKSFDSLYLKYALFSGKKQEPVKLFAENRAKKTKKRYPV